MQVEVKKPEVIVLGGLYQRYDGKIRLLVKTSDGTFLFIDVTTGVETGRWTSEYSLRSAIEADFTLLPKAVLTVEK